MWLIDYFAAQQAGDRDTLYKSRLLAGILLSYLVIIAGFSLYLVSASHLPPVAVQSGIGLLLPLGLFFIVCLFALRRSGRFRLIAQLAIAANYLGIMAGVFVSGGPIDTPATMIIVMPCVLAFCLLGLHSGLMWTVIVFGTNIAGIALALGGFHYPQVAPAEMYETNRIFNWIVAFCSIIAVVIVYENINAQLRRERDRERDRYLHMATHDLLTGLPNRKLFHDALHVAIARANRHDYHVALLMIDLNGFKPINDTLGHEAGDKTLQHVASQLRQAVRQTDTVARIGGDEFTVILEGLDSELDLHPLVDKIAHAIATPVPELENRPFVTGSFGIALYPMHTLDESELLHYADTAMYHAKKHQLGSQIFRPSLLDDEPALFSSKPATTTA